MLFTAVTLGFFAENVREGLSNREKEKVIIESLKEDFIKDTAQLKYLINDYPNVIVSWNDSLHSLVDNKPVKGNEGLFLQAICNSTVWYYHTAGEVAISLTSSAESMNLIENKKIKKELLEYQKNEKFYNEYLKFIVNTFQQTDTANMSISDLKTFVQIYGKTTMSQLFMSNNDIPKYIYFKTNDKAAFRAQLRNIDHADLKIYDLKTIYSMLLVNETNILNMINETYKEVK